MVSPTVQGVVRALSLQLDAGEAAAVAVALERQAGLIVDERRARRTAARMGVPVVGTIGVYWPGGRAWSATRSAWLRRSGNGDSIWPMT